LPFFRREAKNIVNLFSNTIDSLDQALKYSSTKQKTISNNIANVDTPNYKAKEVVNVSSFKTALDSSMNAYRTDQRHYDFSAQTSGNNQIVTQKNVQYNNNGNSVDVDKEMSTLAENQIYYNALTDRMGSKFQSLQNVIRGGK